jgi:hypothetical protein
VCVTGPDDEVTASSLAVEMDIHLDTLVLLAVLVLAVAACALPAPPQQAPGGDGSDQRS